MMGLIENMQKIQDDLGYPIKNFLTNEEIYNCIPECTHLSFCPKCGAEHLVCKKEHIDMLLTGIYIALYVAVY
jgi:hypothetical protein